MPTLFQRLRERGVTFSHVCEVGVFEPETANLLEFIKNNIRATLVEAVPVVAKRIENYFKGRNVTVYNAAIWDYTGRQKLARARASTFVVDLKSSPALQNDKYQLETADTFEVDCLLFSTIDDGTIDLLSVDIEGSEWYVLKYMSSRPRVISIETHGKRYINPFMPEIADWMAKNGYVIWYKDNSDSVYIQNGLFALSVSDKVALAVKENELAPRRAKIKLLSKVGLR